MYVDDSLTKQYWYRGGYTVYPELIKLMAYMNMKHKDLGAILGISQQATSKKIKGESDFKRGEMQKIKEYFKKTFPEITMDQIFTKDIFLS
jgi:predicted transcriptional regulator